MNDNLETLLQNNLNTITDQNPTTVLMNVQSGIQHKNKTRKRIRHAVAKTGITAIIICICVAGLLMAMGVANMDRLTTLLPTANRPPAQIWEEEYPNGQPYNEDDVEVCPHYGYEDDDEICPYYGHEDDAEDESADYADEYYTDMACEQTEQERIMRMINAFLRRQQFAVALENHDNDDIVGHLRIPNTTIDYLITQADDNLYYLYHDIYRRRTAAAWPFLDYMVDVSGQDQNMVIYAHNMGNNQRFHMLRHFQNYDFFNTNRYMYFTTQYEAYRFEIFSFYVANISFPYTLPNYEDWENKINEFAARCMHETNANVSAEDRVLTLTTCENARMDYRFVLHGRLIVECFG